MGNVLKISIVIVVFLFLVIPIMTGFDFAHCSAAPDFTLTDIDGNSVSLSSYRGTVVLLDFFATWCGDCMNEMPHLKTLSNQFQTNLVILSISIDPTTDTVQKLQTFRTDYNVTWEILRDTESVYTTHNVTVIPTIYIIDKEGNVNNKHIGTTDASVLTNEIAPLIPEYSFSIAILVILLSTIGAVLIKRFGARLFLHREKRGNCAGDIYIRC